MTTKINHTLFGNRSDWSPKTIAAAVALLAVISLLAWGGFSETGEARYQAAYDAGRFDEALEIAVSLAEKNPEDSAPRVAAAAALVQKAYQNQNRAASALAAVDFAEEAIALNPLSLGGWRARGAAYQILGDAARAAESYERALAISPNDPALLVQVGGSVSLTDLEEATRYYERALASAPNDPLASLALARAALAVGNFGRAEDALAPALAADVPSALGAEARVTLANLELAQGEGALAEAAAREAIALAPGNADAKVALAQALYDGIFRRHLTPDTTLVEVRSLAAEALALRPTSALAALVSFRAAYAAGDSTAADSAAALARSLVPNDPTLSAEAREEFSAQIDLLQNMEVTVTETSQR